MKDNRDPLEHLITGGNIGLDELSPYGPRTLVDEIDVSGWGVWSGHAIPMKVCRYIAERVNQIERKSKEDTP